MFHVGLSFQIWLDEAWVQSINIQYYIRQCFMLGSLFRYDLMKLCWQFYPSIESTVSCVLSFSDKTWWSFAGSSTQALNLQFHVFCLFQIWLDEALLAVLPQALNLQFHVFCLFQIWLDEALLAVLPKHWIYSFMCSVFFRYDLMKLCWQFYPKHWIYSFMCSVFFRYDLMKLCWQFYPSIESTVSCVLSFSDMTWWSFAGSSTPSIDPPSWR